MAGRGRGRGRPISIGGDQNVGPTEVLPPILNPPRDFPPLEHKPLPLSEAEKRELSYLYQLKKSFAEYMQESPYYVKPTVEKKDIERYSDKYQALSSTTLSYETLYDWDMMPAELKPSAQKKKRKGEKLKTPAAKKSKDVNIEDKLKELEKKETAQTSDVEEEDKDEEKEIDDNVDELEEEVDEEMDDGTDYVNNYFDNGENYEDDDENVDDGAIF